MRNFKQKLVQVKNDAVKEEQREKDAVKNPKIRQNIVQVRIVNGADLLNYQEQQNITTTRVSVTLGGKTNFSAWRRTEIDEPVEWEFLTKL